MHTEENGEWYMQGMSIQIVVSESRERKVLLSSTQMRRRTAAREDRTCISIAHSTVCITDNAYFLTVMHIR